MSDSEGGARAGPEATLAERVAAALGVPVVRANPLGGGMIGQVARCELADGGAVVGKTMDHATARPGTSTSGGSEGWRAVAEDAEGSDGGVPPLELATTPRVPPLRTEARMLRYLANHSDLPVPAVLYGDDKLLVLEHLPGSTGLEASAERHLGALLAALHGLTADAFGFESDTLLGPFRLPNAWKQGWAEFFGEQRLRPFADRALASGRLPRELHYRVQRVADDAPGLLDHEPAPALVHGDVWSGNVLSQGGRVTGVLDPALAYADAEVELAYLDLFATVGRAFHEAYDAERGVRPGYARRRAVYQLVPLLVHVALFGGGYVAAVEGCVGAVGR